ncbi:MAG: uracil-DNA glycosylase [Hyphomicrobiales bacterium]
MTTNATHIAEMEALLEFYAANGVDCAMDDEPHDRFAEMRKAREARMAAMSQSHHASQNNTQLNQPSSPRLAPNASGAPQAPARATTQAVPDAANVETARSLANAANTLEDLHTAFSQFDGCNLKRTAKSLVFADGNPNAQIMLVGDAPGRDEDIEGVPFAGKTGELLTKMLAAIGLNRATDVYIANVVPWRPPGNRTPTDQETAMCLPFIQRQIALVNPDILVPLGGTAVKQLLQTSESILKLRGKKHTYSLGEREIDAFAILHPAYLLRQPAQKRLAWHDLQMLKKRLEEIGPKKA